MMTLEEIVAELQELKRGIDRAEATLFDRCQAIEVGAREVWRQDNASFDSFLEKYFICDARRYRDYVEAKKDRGIAEVSGLIGVSASIQAHKIEDSARREKYLEAARMRQDVAGVPWSDQRARQERLLIAGSVPRDSAMNKVAEDMRRLQADNLRLAKENLDLKRENARLAKENEKLLMKVGKGKKATGPETRA